MERDIGMNRRLQNNVTIFPGLECTSNIENDTLSFSSSNSKSEERAGRYTEATNGKKSTPTEY